MKLAICLLPLLIIFFMPRPAAAAAAASAEALPPQAASLEASSIAVAPLTSLITQPLTATGQVVGQVVNGSGSPLPSELEITLVAVQDPDTAFNIVFTQTATAGVDGNFAFSQIPMVANRSFAVIATYHDVTYGSELVPYDGLTTTLTTPLTIYETTSDGSSLMVEQLHIFVEFGDTANVQIGELFVISNLSNRTLVAPTADSAVVSFTLPPGATDLRFRDGELGDGRYLPTDDGFGDTMPILPGMRVQQIFFAFTLPYPAKLDMAQNLPLAVNSTGIFLQDVGVKVVGDQFVANGVQPMQGATYQMYSGGEIPIHQPLRLQLSGKVNLTGAVTTSRDRRWEWVIGLGVLGVALVGIGVWFYRRERIQSAELADEEAAAPDDLPQDEMDSDALMDAILALDDSHQAGEIPDETYRQRRAELKKRLSVALAEDDPSGDPPA